MLIFSVSRPVAGNSLTPERLGELSVRACQGGHSCEYCGYDSPHNTVVFRDGDPRHTADDNLTVADPYCQAWLALDLTGADSGVMVSLPLLSPEDVNHLQRTLAQALAVGDEQYQQDARALLDWLTSHDKTVIQHWGTAHPQAFAEALNRTPPERRDEVNGRWRHLAIILNPRRLRGRLANTPPENATTWWHRFYLDYRARS
ncbi:hypothetical protein [Klebsiella michiganensis]|uniref:hypothetical protein n=1 Tax=Klebsiella michiganensis TaxID=1134687 RepID=UPI003F4FE8C7